VKLVRVRVRVRVRDGDGDEGAHGIEIHADRPWLHNAPLWLAGRVVV